MLGARTQVWLRWLTVSGVPDDGDVVGDAGRALQTVRWRMVTPCALRRANSEEHGRLGRRSTAVGSSRMRDAHAGAPATLRSRPSAWWRRWRSPRARVDVVAERLQQFAGFLCSMPPVNERTPRTEVFQEKCVLPLSGLAPAPVLVHDADAAFLTLLRRGEVFSSPKIFMRPVLLM